MKKSVYVKTNNTAPQNRVDFQRFMETLEELENLHHKVKDEPVDFKNGVKINGTSFKSKGADQKINDLKRYQDIINKFSLNDMCFVWRTDLLQKIWFDIKQAKKKGEI